MHLNIGFIIYFVAEFYQYERKALFLHFPKHIFIRNMNYGFEWVHFCECPLKYFPKYLGFEKFGCFQPRFGQFKRKVMFSHIPMRGFTKNINYKLGWLYFCEHSMDLLEVS